MIIGMILRLGNMSGKKCIICGDKFNAPPSSKKITCSANCSTERKKISHQGKSNSWGEGKKSKRREKDWSFFQKTGTEKAQKSQIAGPFETNQNAKFWVVVDPDGIEYEVKNLSLFCRENAKRFLPNTPQQACAGLKEVNKWLRGKSKRTVSQWKGWALKQSAKEIKK